MHPVDYFNKRQNEVDSGAAVSMFALLNCQDSSSELLIEYIDEDFQVWGSEVWDTKKGRLGGRKFQETDYDAKLRSNG
jgi:hypothetical protein